MTKDGFYVREEGDEVDEVEVQLTKKQRKRMRRGSGDDSTEEVLHNI